LAKEIHFTRIVKFILKKELKNTQIICKNKADIPQSFVRCLCKTA